MGEIWILCRGPEPVGGIDGELCDSHYDHTMVILWSHYGHTMVTLWSYYGHTMVILWSYYGHTIVTL